VIIFKTFSAGIAPVMAGNSVEGEVAFRSTVSNDSWRVIFVIREEEYHKISTKQFEGDRRPVKPLEAQ
jgi:hypothetical protein